MSRDLFKTRCKRKSITESHLEMNLHINNVLNTWSEKMIKTKN